jgi:hypothetical protein
VAVKTFQLRIPAYRVRPRLTPEKPQQRITLFTQPTDLKDRNVAVEAIPDGWSATLTLGLLQDCP